MNPLLLTSMMNRLRRNGSVLTGLMALLLLLGSFSTQAQTTNAWTGGTDNDWHTTTNWSLTLVPDATHNVLIPGSLTNYPILSGAASVSTVEVRSGASLSINSAGNLSVNGSKPVAIGGFFYIMGFYNGGTIVNSGSLSVGTSAAVGQVALWNASSFTNMATGTITLDNSDQTGLYTGPGSSFVNAGSIRVGTSAAVGFSALWNVSSFTNTATGNITLDNSSSQGLLNSGSFVNSGSVTVGSSAAVGAHALRNFSSSSFTNTATGNITLDNSRNAGLFNHSGGSFVNSATITFGTSLTSAIENQGTFNNQGGGCANPAPGLINSLGDGVITNTSSFSNTGTIIERSTGNSNISFNGGVIQNLNGGSFTFASGSTELTWTGSTSTDWNTATNWCPSVVPTASNNVLIPSGPANQPLISTTAVAHTVEVQSGASLTISSMGSLSVNGSKFGMSVTARFRNQGTVVNDGQVFLGNSPSATSTIIGLRNAGTFTHRAGALMTSDRASYGLYNITASGSFVNSGTLAIGSVGSNGLHALFNADGATFSNTTGGYITLDRATDRALFNDGASSSFVNSATLVIGSIGEVVWQGVWNNGSFRNLAGGFIAIDRTTNVGLVNTNSTTGFINSGTITIGASATIGSDGISNLFGGSFTNTAGGSITIDRTYGSGVYNGVPYLGIECRFLNAATITIGTSLTSAIQNDGTFNNQGGGCANPAPGLINSLGNGIIANSSSFSNTGTIIERSTGNSNISFNGGLIQNLNGGSFTVATESTELTWTGSTSTDWNTATNWCPSMVPTASSHVLIPSGPANQPIISTTAVAHSVEVQSGASLTITSAGSLSVNGSKSGTNGTARFRNQGTVVNAGQVLLGNLPSATAAQIGLRNAGTFTHSAGGLMTIDRVSSFGLYSVTASSSFVNSATIVIGSIAEVDHGVWNSGSFRNLAGGFIAIDRTTDVGLVNSSTTVTGFTNSGIITIGSSATIGSDGLSNFGSFTNTAGGSITIDRTRFAGLYNGLVSSSPRVLASFVNSATITFGTSLTRAIQNDGTFNNQGGGCANPAPGLINSLGDGVITNNSSFSNTGTIIESSTGNSNISFNGGLIQNLNGGSFTVATGSTELTWTGSTSTDWNTATNWCPTSVPTASNNVLIPSGPANQPIISTTAVAYTVEVQSGASLTITSAGSLSVNGSKSGTNGTARFRNQGTVVNDGQVLLGNSPSATAAQLGLWNAGTFTQNASGLMTIDRADTYGLYNVTASGSFVNSGTLAIGAVSSAGAFYQLTNSDGATFNNATGGYITLDRATNRALWNTTANSSFVNSATIMIGSIAGVNQGIWNFGSFRNLADGFIAIDRTTDVGLSNSSTTVTGFTNSGTITIGASATIGSNGLSNFGSFTNTAGGSITIDRTRFAGLYNGIANSVPQVLASFVNSATITFGTSLTRAIENDGIFNNQGGGCANPAPGLINSLGNGVIIEGVANSPKSFSNTGTIIESSTGNSGISFNGGVIQNLNGGLFTVATPSFTTTLTVGPSSTLTCAQTSLTLTATGGASYTFAGPGLSQSGSMATAAVSQSGVFSVTATDATGCTSTTSTTISSNTTAPILSLAASNSLNCSTTSATLSATAGGFGSLTYTFTGGALPGSPSTNSTITVNQGGSYSVLVTAANGCTALQSTSVASDGALPSVTLSANGGGTLTCALTSLTLSATGGTSYTFTGSGLVNQSSSGSAVVNQAGTFTVTAAGSNGCTATQTTTVFSNTTAPMVSISATSGTLTCAVTSITLTATSSSTGLLWSNAATTQSITVNSAGTYSVTATGGVGHPGNGCSAVSNTITIGTNTAAPTGAMLTASNSGTLTCAVQTLTLTATATGTSLSYVFGGLSGSDNTRPVSASGLYSVTITGANGCTTSASTTVYSNTLTPTAGLVSSGTITCSVPAVTLTASGGASVPGGTYSFNGPGIVSISGNLATVNLGGTYSVTVLNPANGCFATNTVSVSSDIGGASAVPTLSASSSVVCAGTNVMVVATGGISPMQPNAARWYRDGQLVAGQTSATLSLGGVQAAQAGSYVLVVSGACSVTSAPFVLTVNSLPTVLLTFPNGSTVVGPGTGMATITLPSPFTGVSFQAFGGTQYERLIIIDRTNGYEIRQVDQNTNGIFNVNRTGPFSLTVTGQNGCKRIVEGVIATQ